MNFIAILAFTIFTQAASFSLDKETGQAIPDHIGELKLKKGEVSLEKNGQAQPLKEGAKFRAKDVLITGEKSLVRIQMVDDSQITLGPQSRMEFSEFVYKDKSNRQMLLSLIKGQSDPLIKNKAKEGDLRVKTGGTIMGVRGTEFFANHRQQQNLDISDFAVLSGDVDVTDPAQEKTPLKRGEKLTIIWGGPQKTTGKEKTALTEEAIKSLTPEEQLLPFTELSQLSEKSPLKALTNSQETSSTSTQEADGPSINKASPKAEKNWRDSLKKLNQKLKENQRK